MKKAVLLTLLSIVLLNSISYAQTLTTKLVTLGSRLALNPRLQFSAFYQYNDFDQHGRWNIRTSWEFQPQSFVYLVFNDRQINSLDNPFSQQQFVTKINFVKQF